MKNLYEILNIERDTTPDQIKKAYYQMAKKYHPDSPSTQAGFQAGADKSEIHKFHEVTEAYRILSDKEARRAYNLALDGGKIEKVLTEDPPVHPTIFREEGAKDEEFRKKEMSRFRRRIFLQGGLKAFGFSVFMSIIGYVLSFILGGNLIIGSIICMAVGLVWGINGNFDIPSFIRSPKRLLVIQIISLMLQAGGVGYFGWLAVSMFV
jgi:hypothetical protein